MQGTWSEDGRIFYLKQGESFQPADTENIGMTNAELWTMWLHLRNPENRHGLKEEEDLFQVVHKSIMLRASMVCVSIEDVPPPPGTLTRSEMLAEMAKSRGGPAPAESKLPSVTWRPG